MTTAATNLEHIVAVWYTQFAEQGGRVGKPLSDTFDLATSKAKQYAELGTAYVDLQPGNGTRYLMVLHDLISPWIRQVDAETTPLNTPEERAAVREYGRSKTMASRVGGELLVSMPENGRGGHSCVLSVGDGALYTPDYIGEVLALNYGDAIHVAAFLSAFVQAVADSRRT